MNPGGNVIEFYVKIQKKNEKQSIFLGFICKRRNYFVFFLIVNFFLRGTKTIYILTKQLFKCPAGQLPLLLPIDVFKMSVMWVF